MNRPDTLTRRKQARLDIARISRQLRGREAALRRCAFLTLENPEAYFIDDDLAYAPLGDLGWSVEAVPWRRAADFRAYDAVVIRSPWDYTDDPEAFLEVLRGIERAEVPLFNGLGLVTWNLRKTYLRDLEARGVPVIPTVWRDKIERGKLWDLFDEVGAGEIVVKPVVGATASGAFRLDRGAAREQASVIEAYYADRALMAQPFVPAVIGEGEFSLFYFNGELSHAILKRPKPRDFRVQEEHGGIIQSVRAESGLREAGNAALRALGETPLYARADLVRAPGGDGFWLMELELVEPSLYLRMDEEAPRRFARALDEQARLLLAMK